MTFEFWYTTILFIAMIVILVRELVEAEIAIFSVLILLLIGGVINVKQTFIGFSNEGMLTIALLFIVASAIHNSGAISRLNKLIFGKSESGITSKLFRLLFPVAGISAFMNNTPVVAILTPTIRSWADRTHYSASKFLMPISFAAILGGMCTLVGTSTNLIIYGLMIDFGMEGLGLFEISKVGVPIAIIGLLYIIFFGNKLLPEHKKTMSTLEDNTREFFIELKVIESYPHIGKSIEEAGLRHLKGLYLFEIERDDEIITPARPTEIIQLDDRLFFTGLPKTILDLQKTPGLQLLKDCTFDLKQYDSSQIRPFEAVVSVSSPLIGKKIRNSNFRETYNAVIIAIHRNGARINKKIGDIIIHSGDTLLLLADKKFYNEWYASSDFFLISRSEQVPSKPRWQAILSVFSLGVMIILILFKILPIVAAAGIAATVLLFTRTITTLEARHSIDFRVIIIIASSLGLAEALTESGVAQFLANSIVAAGGTFGPLGVITALFIITSIFTNFMTNNATAAILFPIVFASAQQMQADPRPFIIALAIATSASFATPISYQTNLMVYGPGGYTFKDFFRVGFPLQIFVTIAAIVLINYFYY